jgi:squalene-hopene/tetraprenyl-beta-curcumene cyclase
VAAVDERGAIDAPALGLGYPVYAASLAVIALSQPNVAGSREVLRARDAWLALLLSHQLDESLGWQPDDLAYGGFGYALEPPAKGLRGDFDADLSSTLFALGALAIAGRHAGDPAVARALAFAERCQNFGSGDPAFDDGGFFFTPTNEYQNKAGSPGSDARGVRRYHSYGSMTADGLRALLRGGLPRDHPRVLAAAGWLAAHFDAASNPGAFEPAREVERDASYYYWCWSVAHALRALELCELATPRGPLDWTEALARELLARQRPDGSWTNRFTLVKEDDPLIATALAAAALGLCRLQRLTVPR